MRITVQQILKALAGGLAAKDLLEDYPELEEDDIKAALLYASELVGEERIFAVSAPRRTRRKDSGGVIFYRG